MSRTLHQRWTAIAPRTRSHRAPCRSYSTAEPPAPGTSSKSASSPKLSAAALYFAPPASSFPTIPAPTPASLSAARTFFSRPGARAVPYFTASALHQVPLASALPEVAFLGRSNAGKSTLLNALLGSGVCRTSSKPGRTRALHAYAAGGLDSASNSPGFVAVLDMPGYGLGSRAEWGTAVSRYLAARRQLRRAYVLVDALHGAKDTDAAMLDELRACGVPAQLVLSKVDRLVEQRRRKEDWSEQEIEEALARVRDAVDAARAVARPRGAQGVLALEEVLCVAAEPGRRVKLLSREVGGRLGIDALRWSVLQATGFVGETKKKAIPSDVKIDEDR